MSERVNGRARGTVPIIGFSEPWCGVVQHWRCSLPASFPLPASFGPTWRVSGDIELRREKRETRYFFTFFCLLFFAFFVFFFRLGYSSSAKPRYSALFFFHIVPPKNHMNFNQKNIFTYEGNNENFNIKHDFDQSLEMRCNGV